MQSGGKIHLTVGVGARALGESVPCTRGPVGAMPGQNGQAGSRSGSLP